MNFLHGMSLGGRHTIDRFHMQELACDALQEMRIAHRWDGIKDDYVSRDDIRKLGVEYKPTFFSMIR